MLCINGQKLLKIKISCMFWPNSVCNFFNDIVLWNMFSRAHFQHFIAIVPYFGPFQGVMLCKNGPKLLQIDISCIFWPNNVWKLFYYIILWHHFSRAYFQHFLSFGAGRGTIARRTCYFHMKYVLSIVSLVFSLVTLAHLTHIWTLSGGFVMSKWPISTFLAPFDILSSRHCRETPALLACSNI